MSDLVIVERLLLVMVLAGFIGYERERHGRAAGFRTHILVGVGSCLIMLTDLHLMEALAGRVQVDPARMAAQVVSGIGFLGAGTILRHRASIRGLTTAASLWAVAGIGLAVGSGFVFGACAAAGIVLVALFGLAGWERRMRRVWYKVLVVEVQNGLAGLSRIRQVLSEYEVEILDFDLKSLDDAGHSSIELNLKLVSDRDDGVIVSDLLQQEGIRRAHWA